MAKPIDQRDKEISQAGEDLAMDGLLREYARAGEGADDAFVSRVMDAVEALDEQSATPAKPAQPVVIRPIEPAWSWLGGRRFWKVAASVACLGLALVLGKASLVMTSHASPAELIVYGQPELTPGLTASFRVLVRDAETAAGLADATVGAVLRSQQGERIRLPQTTTDPHGFALAEAALPENMEEGSYTLQVWAKTARGNAEVSRPVAVKRSFRTMLSTDKPLYQPGQVIHIRSLTLANADLRPVAGRDVVLEVQDTKGNKVFKKVVQISRFGIASADFELADQVSPGHYTVSATMGDTISQRSVEVSRYVLPKYKVELRADRGFYQPGAVVRADLQAEYTFGKPVAGARVLVSAEALVEEFRPFSTVQGRTDSKGRFEFEVQLPEFFAGSPLNKGDADVRLVATVTDGAQHQQVKSLPLTVTVEAIRVEVFPESGQLVQNVENTLYIVTAYPDGRPAQTRLTLGADQSAIETSEVGIATVRITPQTPALQLTIDAQDRQGQRVRAVRPLRVGQRSDAFLLRTDRAVYKQGDSAQLEILSAESQARVFVDVVKDRRTLLMQAIDVLGGRGSLALDLAADMFGTLELHAYRILADGSIIRDSRVIQVNRSDALKVSARLDQQSYRPAEKAVIELAVQRPDGSPAAAALSLAAVDEAVFALSEMRPGLEELYFVLQQELLKPRYELHAPVPIKPWQCVLPESEEQDLLSSLQRPAAQLEEARVVLFSAAQGSGAPQRHASQPLAERQAQLEREREGFYRALAQGALLTPFALYLLTLLPFGLYLAGRLRRRLTLESAGAGDRAEFDKRSRHVAWWWLGAVLSPMAVAAIVYYAFNRGLLGGLPSVALVGLTAMAGLEGIDSALLKLRRCAAMQMLPTMRKLTRLLPWCYLLGLATIALLMASPGRMLQGYKGLIILSTWLSAGLVFVVLSLARQTILKPVGWGRIAWLLVSRTAAVLLLAYVALSMPSVSRKPAFHGFIAPLEEDRFLNAFAIAEEVPMARQHELLPDRSSVALPPPAVPDAAHPPRIRRHFPETLFWQPQLITDESGQAKLELPLADSVTTWRLALSAVSDRGELGAATQPIRVFQDFFVDIDFPVELTQNDEVSLPIAVFNYLPAAQTVRLEVQPADWYELLDAPALELHLAANQVGSAQLRLRAVKPGRHRLTVQAFGSHLSDAVQRSVNVKPDGKPVVRTFSGRLSASLNQSVDFPADAIEGGSDLFVKIYPGSFSQVVEGLDSILRMPYGCFEQTSSTTYPNVLVLDYLRRTRQINPEIEMKALSYINLGYQRLLSFEVEGGGFEWFGKAPAHNVLTAYGLLEFADMSKVFEVDPSVIDRTRQWLYGQQQSDGRWKPSQGKASGAVSRFSDEDLRTTAYISWTLAESGQSDPRLDLALRFLESGIAAAKDPYLLALAANAFAAADRSGAANRVLGVLEGLKTAGGDFAYWESPSEGVTYSRGNSLAIETTAMAAYAMLKANSYGDTAQKALAWLISQKDARGTWHSTSATVHAMRALLAGTDGGAAVEGDGRLNVTVSHNGQLAGSLEVTPEDSDVHRLVSLRGHLREGVNQIALETDSQASLAYQIVATHHLPWPPAGRAAEEEPLTISVEYDSARLQADELLQAWVKVAYNRPGSAPMALVDLGIPPGFEVQPDAFEQLKERGVIEKYSISGRQAVLYFQQIAGGDPVTFSYLLRAKHPLRVKAPASVAYLYYQPEVRGQSEPVTLEVVK